MKKVSRIGQAAMVSLYIGLSACTAPGSTERALSDQAAWASSLGIERNRTQATTAVAQPDGNVRLTVGEMKPAAPPPIIAQLTPPVAAPTPAPEVAAPAAPLAAASVAQAVPESERREVLTEILSWRKAWAEGDANAYISHYERSFHGELTSRSAWEKQRRQRLASGDIAVKMLDLTLRIVDGVAEAEFEQRYISNKHEDVGIKTMKLRKIDGKWLITQERWRKT